MRRGREMASSQHNYGAAAPKYVRSVFSSPVRTRFEGGVRITTTTPQRTDNENAVPLVASHARALQPTRNWSGTKNQCCGNAEDYCLWTSQKSLARRRTTRPCHQRVEKGKLLLAIVPQVTGSLLVDALRLVRLLGALLAFFWAIERRLTA